MSAGGGCELNISSCQCVFRLLSLSLIVTLMFSLSRYVDVLCLGYKLGPFYSRSMLIVADIGLVRFIPSR